MSIVRLALANPSANTDSLIHTATRQSLVSVIATNTGSATAQIDIWVAPQGATSASAYAYMSKNSIVPVGNSLETFRFALENNDSLYVRSTTSNVSFSVNAIYESSGSQNIITVSSTSPNSPSIGDVWTNPSASAVYFWNGSSWTSAVAVAGVSSVNGASGAITNIASTISPTFTGTVGIPGVGTNQIKSGTGDGASFTTFNTRIRSWWGIGFTDYQDLNTATVYIDTRNGIIGASGTPTSSEHLTTKAYVDSVADSAGFNPFFLSGM